MSIVIFSLGCSSHVYFELKKIYKKIAKRGLEPRPSNWMLNMLTLTPQCKLSMTGRNRTHMRELTRFPRSDANPLGLGHNESIFNFFKKKIMQTPKSELKQNFLHECIFLFFIFLIQHF